MQNLCIFVKNCRIADGTVFRGCTLGEALNSETLNLPPPAPFPGESRPFNHFIVADDAFGMTEYLLKPFSHLSLSIAQRIFNYRLSRARRVVENAFGILANRFRVFLKPIHMEVEKVEKIVLGACALHNFLRVRIGDSYISQVVDREVGDAREVVQGEWRSDPPLRKVKVSGNRNSTGYAKEMRNYYCSYVNSCNGAVPWQWDRAFS